MARIYRRPETDLWYAEYKVPGKPRPVRESTGTADEAAAKRFLEARIRETGRARVVGPSAERAKFKDLEKLITDDYRLKGRRSISDLENSLRHLRAVFQHYRAVDISAPAITAYASDRLAANAAPGSINRELAALRRMMRLGVKHGLIAAPPWIELLTEAAPRQERFEHGEFAAVRDAMPEAMRGYVEALYYTGVRRTQMALLEWRDVFADRVVMRADTTKNGHAHVIPLEGEFARVIEQQRGVRRIDCRFVFHLEGRPLVYEDGSASTELREAWAAALASTGLADRLMHDFRRSAATNLARSGVPEQVAMQITGHKTAGMYRRYNIVDQDVIAEALRRQSEFLGAQPAAPKVVPIGKRQG